MPKRSKAFGLVVAAFSLAALCCAVHGAQEKQQPKAVYGDVTVSGFQSWRAVTTPTGTHFHLIHGPGSLISLVSTKKKLAATCQEIEGDVNQSRTLSNATMSGGVNATVQRPSSEKGGAGTQTATAEGSQAIYWAANNTLDLQQHVVLHDSDPAADRVFHATGSSALVGLSAPNSTGEAFRTVDLNGPVKMDVKGTRLETNPDTKKTGRVPFAINSTSDHATFDNIQHKLVLKGHVHVVSDDMTVGETYGDSETILFNADGSVKEAFGDSSPGITTLTPETFKGP